MVVMVVALAEAATVAAAREVVVPVAVLDAAAREKVVTVAVEKVVEETAAEKAVVAMEAEKAAVATAVTTVELAAMVAEVGRVRSVYHNRCSRFRSHSCCIPSQSRRRRTLRRLCTVSNQDRYRYRRS